MTEYPTEATEGRKDEPGLTVYPGREVTVAGTRGRWSHCIYSQEAARDECLCLDNESIFKNLVLSLRKGAAQTDGTSSYLKIWNLENPSQTCPESGLYDSKS